MKVTASQLQQDFERNGVRSSYSIAFSMRCGSTVLAQTLGKFGVGSPTEYFRYPYDENSYFPNSRGLPVADWFRELVVGRQHSGVFGSKMSHDHRARIDEHLREQVTGYSTLSDALPNHRWIFMRRGDTIAQAVSWYVASCTDRWHVPSDERDAVSARVPYDFFSILSKVMILGANNVNWEAYFSRLGIEPCRIEYEELVDNPKAVVQRIFEFLGLERKTDEIELERDGGLKAIAHIAGSPHREIQDRFTDDFMRLGESSDRGRLGPSLERWSTFFSKSGWRA